MAFYNSLVVCLALVAFVALAFSFESCHAFSLSSPRATQTCSFPTMIIRPTISALRAEEGSSEAEESVAESAEEAASEEEMNEEKEDPDVKALKDEIAELEKTLKAKKSQIQYLKDSNETFSKAGYARKVAEMENMRRARSVSHLRRFGYWECVERRVFWGDWFIFLLRLCMCIN
jgi:hypothetical protein